jgi:DNA-binding FadR family transcriptional regulator
LDRKYFDQFSDLRQHIEASYWFSAVQKLTDEDKDYLKNLVDKAWEKLRGTPIRLPQVEHRELHLTIYSRLGNPFVKGILDAYWEAYEEVGYNRYTDMTYLQKVWQYHSDVVDSIRDGDYEKGYRVLLDHMELIKQIHHE